MGNQTGKEKGVPKYDASKEGTREIIASWHRYGVDVWDVYEYVDDLGQGHMGQIFQVRRKKRSAHNEITRQKQKELSSEVRVGSERPKLMEKVKSSPDLIPKMAIKKAIRSGGKINEVDVPPKKPLAVPPESPSPPKPILKRSQYSNPTNEIPNIDDESVDEEDEEIHMNQWKEKIKGRVEHIAGHRSEMLDQLGTVDCTDVLPADPLSSNPKVVFKRQYACKVVLISRIKGGLIEDMLNEIYILRSLDHPYIIKLYEIYQVKRMYMMAPASILAIYLNSLLLVSNRKALDDHGAMYRRRLDVTQTE